MLGARFTGAVLAILALFIVDDPRWFSYGYIVVSTDVSASDASTPVATSKTCWIFSHMPKSGGVTIQSMLRSYAKRHGVALGRYDSEDWVKGSGAARSFLDADYDLMGGGYTDGLRPHGGQDCKWFTMFRQ